MKDSREKIEEIISSMITRCGILVAIPRMNPTAEEYANAFKEFTRQKQYELQHSKYPLVTSSGFIYAESHKMKKTEYREKFIDMCQETNDNICILGMTGIR